MNWATATMASTAPALARTGSLRVSETSGMVGTRVIVGTVVALDWRGIDDFRRAALACVGGFRDPLGEHDRRGVDRHRGNDRDDRGVDHAERIGPAHRATR